MRELDSTLESLWSTVQPAGLGAAVRLDGRLIWSGATGLADREKRLPLTPGARTCIYSLTKTFTAVLILKLAEAGALRLGDSARQWFPVLPGEITLAHLLRHTSGLRDYGSLTHYHEAVRQNSHRPWSDEEYLEATLPTGLLFAPGTGWAYSNIGYLFLRRLIEQVTGQSFAKNIALHITRPLGLVDTFVAEAPQDWATCVPGYGAEVFPSGETGDVRSRYHPDWCAPAVAVSTPEDASLFYHRLLNGEVLQMDSLQAMCAMVDVPGHHPPTVRAMSGFGLLGDPENPIGPSHGHGGSGPGYSIAASTVQAPPGRISLMIFSNASGIEMGQMERALIETAAQLLET